MLEKLPEEPISLALNAVVIRNNPRLRIEDLCQKVQFKQVVFDASNSRHNVDKWKIACITHKISFYDVGESGAWVHNF